MDTKDDEIKDLRAENKKLKEDLDACRLGVKTMHDMVEQGKGGTIHTESGATAEVNPVETVSEKKPVEKQS